MRTIIPALILIITALCSEMPAQSLPQFENNYTEKKHSIELSSDYLFSSNAITNQFVKAWATNSFIDSTDKNTVYKKLKASNRAGGTFNAGVRYTSRRDSLFGMANASLSIGFFNRSHANTSFSKDLFDVVFYGNKRYAAKTADFSGFNLNLFKYQQFQLGLITRTDREAFASQFGVSLSLLKGQQHVSITADNATLYTAADGDYLDVNAAITMYQTDTNHVNITDVNGMGASASLYYSIRNKANGDEFVVELNDFGFIRWNNKSIYTNADTSFHFDGVDVDNLFNLKDSVYVKSNSDSTFAQKYLSDRKNRSYKTLLPLFLQFSYEKTIRPDKLQLRASVNYYYSANYLPLISLTAKWFVNKKLVIAPGIHYGGYNGLFGSLGIAKDFGKGFVVNASVLLPGWVLPAATSQGAFVCLKKIF